MAYVSRFDVTDEYLDQLGLDSTILQALEPPRVRRSRLLNITNTEQRLELAMIAARMVLEELSQYKSNKDSGLMDRLRA